MERRRGPEKSRQREEPRDRNLFEQVDGRRERNIKSANGERRKSQTKIKRKRYHDRDGIHATLPAGIK